MLGKWSSSVTFSDIKKMAEPVILSGIFTDYILPFLLVFTLIFAILDRTKILGEGKRQINAIVALVVGLFLISFSYARQIVVNLMPVLAVAAVVLLVFMLLTGWVRGESKMEKPLQYTLMVIIALVVIVGIIWAAGLGNNIISLLSTNVGGAEIWINALFIIVVIAAIVAVLWGGGKEKKEEKS